MRKLFSNVKTWWDKKTYQQKNNFGIAVEFVFIFPMLFCMFFLNAPIVQATLALGLIAVSLVNLRRSLKHFRESTRENNRKIAELNNQEIERKIKRIHEDNKSSYDKDTQEALRVLFNKDENDDVSPIEDKKNDVQTFNSIFKK